MEGEALEFYKTLQAEYEITDSGGVSLLLRAAEALQRLRQCQKIIDGEGLTQLDRFNQAKPHPLLAAERDARAQFLQALKQLDLDIDVPLKLGPGRPLGPV